MVGRIKKSVSWKQENKEKYLKANRMVRDFNHSTDSVPLWSVHSWTLLGTSVSPQINSNSGPYFPDSAPASYHVSLLWVCGYSFCDMALILWKCLFLAFSPLFIYLRQDLQCSSAKRSSSSRFSCLVLLSVELETFINIPQALTNISTWPSVYPLVCSSVAPTLFTWISQHVIPSVKLGWRLSSNELYLPSSLLRIV